MLNLSEEIVDFHREEITEDLPAELLKFSDYSRESNASLSIVPNAEEADEPTTVEVMVAKPAPSPAAAEPLPFPERLMIFLSSPYNPHPLSDDIKQYFREVRQRIIESHRYDKIHYAHTLYQRGVRRAHRIYLYMRANLERD